MKSLLRINRITWLSKLTILLATFAFTDVGVAEFVLVDKSGSTNCQHLRFAGYSEKRESSSIQTVLISDEIRQVILFKTSRFWAPGESPPLYPGFLCDEYVVSTYKNTPQPPSIWDKIPTIQSILYNLFRTKETKQRPPEFRIKTPNGVVTGRRGSLIGFSLVEHSPDGAIGEVVLTQAEIDAGEKVFVLVDSKGDEDWLEFGVLGGPDGVGNFTNRVVFKQPLADFETNQWYEIQVPASFLVAGTNSYTYFLNSAGGTNSSVFFATGTIEDLAPTVSHLSVTNNSIGLGLSNLVEGYSYTVEQTANSFTNWQQAVSFAASNQVETLSLPMTNSAMFYRIALPVP